MKLEPFLFLMPFLNRLISKVISTLRHLNLALPSILHRLHQSIELPLLLWVLSVI